MAKLKGAALIAQSGGPTAVINSSVAGAVLEARKHQAITKFYAADNGILGVLKEELFNLYDEEPKAIDMLLTTPSAATGSCRFKLKDLKQNRADYERILEVFKAHDIRYFFYNGGNDSMDTADKVAQLAREIDYDLVVMGIPKTIDNDLACTDHCPGYGSVIKYNAASAMEAARDTDSLHTFDVCTVHEVMGRNAGWIAAGCALAKRSPADGPHLIYLPEAPFIEKNFVEDVKAVYRKYKRCFIVVGEGLVGKDGKPLAMETSKLAVDSFGHGQMGGVADFLKAVIEKHVGIKTRTNRAGTTQRAAMHFASKTDRDEAALCGRMAVREAMKGASGKMVTLVRVSNAPYKITTGLALLADVANGEKKLPRSWINARGNMPNKKFLDYARPLIQGEVQIPVEGGLPLYMRFQRKIERKKCKGWKPSK